MKLLWGKFSLDIIFTGGFSLRRWSDTGTGSPEKRSWHQPCQS